MKLLPILFAVGTTSVALAQTPDRALLDQYCVSCHNQKAKAAGLALDKLDIANVGADAESWEKVVRKLNAGLMPPAGAKRPDRAAVKTFLASLEG